MIRNITLYKKKMVHIDTLYKKDMFGAKVLFQKVCNSGAVELLTGRLSVNLFRKLQLIFS